MLGLDGPFYALESYQRMLLGSYQFNNILIFVSKASQLASKRRPFPAIVGFVADSESSRPCIQHCSLIAGFGSKPFGALILAVVQHVLQHAA
jgi:hypothetical protein